MLKNRGKNN